MPREGYFYMKVDKGTKETLQEFIDTAGREKTQANTQAEFLNEMLPLMMMAIDAKAYMDIFMKKNGKMINRIKAILELAQVMCFYDEEKDAFNTEDGYIKLEPLINNGYSIKDGKLSITKRGVK